jgi:hypothetical protein
LSDGKLTEEFELELNLAVVRDRHHDRTPSPFLVMKMGSSDSRARSEISFGLLLRSEIGFMTGTLNPLSLSRLLYYIILDARPCSLIDA